MPAEDPESSQGRERCITNIERVTQDSTAKLLDSVLGPASKALEQDAWEEVASGVTAALDALSRRTIEFVKELSELDTEETRKQLKAQQKIFDLKLARTRTAGNVLLKNQAAEMEAAAAAAAAAAATVYPRATHILHTCACAHARSTHVSCTGMRTRCLGACIFTCRGGAVHTLTTACDWCRQVRATMTAWRRPSLRPSRTSRSSPTR